MAWEKTWLYRVRDCYLAPWKLNEESISAEDLPARAFDTPEEKERVAMILEQYNNDLTLTPEEDAALLNWHANAPPVIPCGRMSGCCRARRHYLVYAAH